MITLHLSGGLGNQLFNYAAARSLADHRRTGLIIDAAAYRGAGRTRPFLLHHFPRIRARLRNTSETAGKAGLGCRLARRVREDFLATKVTRKYESVAYFPGFATLGSQVVLRGHYIDRRFFEWNESRVLEDISLPDDFLKTIYAPVGRDMLVAIQREGPSVSVHVRRGDLLAPHARWLLLPEIEKYYERAMSIMQERLASRTPVFWVFSDDMAWCKKAFRHFEFDIRYAEEFEDGSNAIRDYYLMSRCEHHIIANSSFSLWSASLNLGRDKLVLVPHKWDSEGRVNVDNMVPREWERVSW